MPHLRLGPKHYSSHEHGQRGKLAAFPFEHLLISSSWSLSAQLLHVPPILPQFGGREWENEETERDSHGVKEGVWRKPER
jgi:hypothetical protein